MSIERLIAVLTLLLFCGCAHISEAPVNDLHKIDAEMCARFGIGDAQRAVGLLDLRTGKSVMIHPDRVEYAASIAKIGILLAWIEENPTPDAQTRHELGLMVKASSNEMASKFSQQMGLKSVQETLNRRGFYDAANGGGIWVGKHYGISGERIPDPVGGNSHAVTVRQVLRFYQLLDREELVSREASRVMKEIFASPEIPHDDLKFVRGLKGRNLKILRKWGSWEDWQHDSAIIEGKGRRYALVGLTKHPRGDEYLEALAARVDDLMQK